MAVTLEHGSRLETYWPKGAWPECKCGFAPRDNDLLNAHYAEHGFSEVDHHGRLVQEPITKTSGDTRVTRSPQQEAGTA